MADKIILKADKREVFGRKVKAIRKEGIVPANIFGKDVKSISIQVSRIEFEKAFKKAGETQIIELEIGKEKRPVLVSNIQFDPKSDAPLHVDFMQIDLTKKVTAEVPLELVGESPAEKEGKGTVVQQLSEVKIEALPGDLPEKIEINVEELAEIDSSVNVGDLKISDKLTVLDDKELLIVKVEALREEEPEPEAPEPEGEEGVEDAETKTEGEKTEESGEKVKEAETPSGEEKQK